MEALDSRGYNLAKNRVAIIDVAKGISIFLVVFGHLELTNQTLLNESLSLFRMPLFFFLAGVFFTTHYSGFDYLIKKSDQLLKPYFVTSIALLGILIVTEGVDILFGLMHLSYGNRDTIRWGPMWYITHLWLVFVSAYFLHIGLKLDNRSVWFRSMFIVLLLLSGKLLLELLQGVNINFSIMGRTLSSSGLPFSMDSLGISLAYFFAGRFLQAPILVFTPRWYLLGLATMGFVIAAFYTDAWIDIGNFEYDVAAFATLGAVSGLYLVLALSYWISKHVHMTKVFTLLGASSLFILIFHFYIQFKVYQFINAFTGNQYVIVSSIIALIMSILIPIVIRRLCLANKFTAMFYFPVYQSRLLKN